jgi:hypothetical protein
MGTGRLTRSTRETEILKKEGAEFFLFRHSARNSTYHKIVPVPLFWPLLGTPRNKSDPEPLLIVRGDAVIFAEVHEYYSL